MKYYAELQNTLLPMSFEFPTEELRDDWVAKENAKATDEYNRKAKEHEDWGKQLKKLMPEAEVEPYTGYREVFAPLTEQELLGKYGTRIHKRIYELDDRW